jgi:sugar fermentation stimulation protein A
MEPTEGARVAYRFPERLEEGVVLARPNRFIMTVSAGGRTLRCHCPATVRLGELRVSDIPCLFSRAKGGSRKTEATVEAISLDPPRKRNKSWVGINQSAANRYVEFFLRAGLMPEMASGEVRREVRLGSSRIDFLVGSTYVEVKTPLTVIPMPAGLERVKRPRLESFDRLIKHMGELGSALGRGGRAVILLCYLYDAEPFRVPATDGRDTPVLSAARRAVERGMERWQVNLRVDAGGVAMLRYFRNDFLARDAPRAPRIP